MMWECCLQFGDIGMRLSIIPRYFLCIPPHFIPISLNGDAAHIVGQALLDAQAKPMLKQDISLQDGNSPSTWYKNQSGLQDGRKLFL